MRFAIALLVLTGASAQPPSFRAGRVLPSNSDRSSVLAPGMLVSIYGDRLGPAAGCAAPATGRPGYPAALCGVQVTLGDKSAGLLFVQEKQINFQVPQDAPISGTAELRVLYQGESGTATVRVGLETVTLSVEGVARINGPIWIQLEFPVQWRNSGEQYPKSILPDQFGCSELEVRRNGVALPRIAVHYHGGGVMSGNPCGHLTIQGGRADRLPLHVQYRIGQAGVYEVRYTRYRGLHFDGRADNILLRSAWTPIEVLAAAPRAATVAPADAAGLLSDYLPNLLAFPDSAALTAMLAATYHRDTIVRRYAANALSYWPDAEAGPRALAIVQSRGPTDALIDRVAQEHPEILDSFAPYLLSNDPILLRGALLAARHHTPALDTALLEAGEHFIATADPQTLNDYVSTLGGIARPRAVELLWDYVRRGVHVEQAAIAISWHKDLQDMPRLVALLPTQPSLVYALRNSYGEPAIPFLEAALAGENSVAVRTSCARELMVAGRASGFAFAATAIEQNAPYKREMAQAVRDRIPELRAASDAEVAAFLRKRTQ
jgi:hypothetical protein